MLTAEYDFDEHMQVVQEEAWENGLSQGLCQGRSEGRSEGLSQGRSEGRSEGLNMALRGLMDTMKCTPEEALDAMRIPESERKLALAGL